MVKRALTLLTSILIALPLLMPFNIFANATQIIQTDFLSTVSSDWKYGLIAENYCESSNGPQNYGCKLTINITKNPRNYYGLVTLHGYDSSGTKWINYGDVYIADGVGEYNYNLYANGIKEISRVEIYNVSLVQPTSNVDLSQIISLLTSINNYEQQIKNSVDGVEDNQITTINEIRNVINELIEVNGYLEVLTKMRSWNIPFESFPIVFGSLYSDPVYFQNYDYDIKFPVFDTDVSSDLGRFYLNSSEIYTFVMMLPITSLGTFNNNFEFYNDRGYTTTITNFKANSRTTLQSFTNGLCLIKFNIQSSNNGFFIFRKKSNLSGYYMPIYWNLITDKNISTDFALLFGLTNRFLDNIDIIANGTTASQSAAQSSDSANSQLQTDSNTLFQQEDSFKSDMNNAMQNVNNTFRLQDMGTKFVISAQWVRTQYEQFTNNTPFASLITFSLITGLALILLGKVYK